MPGPRHLGGVERDTFDAVVIGGGPAGAVSAMGLARSGWRVGLVERHDRGRDTCCGWCLNPRVGPLLDRLGLRRVVSRASLARTTGVRVHPSPGVVIDLPFDADAGWLTPRAALDAALLDAAAERGVTLLLAVTATVAPTDHNRFTVLLTRGQERRPVTPALIVGADGLGSAVARAGGLTGSRGRVGRAYGCSIDAPSTDDALGAAPGRVEMFLVAGGYLGCVRHGAGVHAAALVRPRRRERPEAPDRFLERAALTHPDVRLYLGAEPCPSRPHAAGPMPWRPGGVAAPGVALVGDAAGYAEPFTGEGLTWAIESAALLAESADTPGVFGRREAARFTTAWRRAVGRAQRRCALIGAALRCPGALARSHRLSALATTRVGRRVTRRVVRRGAPA